MFGIWFEAGERARQEWRDIQGQAIKGAEAAEVIDNLILDSEIEKTKANISRKETEIGTIRVQIDVLEEKLAGLECERAQRKLATQAIAIASTH